MASLWQSIKNFFRGKKDAAASALADPIRDAGFAIEDSERVCEDFEGKVANLMAQNGRNAISAKVARADERKWTDISVAAAKANNRMDCETSLKKKNEAALKAERLEDETKRNEAIIVKLRQTLDGIKEKISRAKSNKDVLEARLKGAQVREELLRASGHLGGTGPLSALDDLEKTTIDAETHADAIGELAGEGQESLEDKYAVSNFAIQGEVDRLIAEHKKPC